MVYRNRGGKGCVSIRQSLPEFEPVRAARVPVR